MTASLPDFMVNTLMCLNVIIRIIVGKRVANQKVQQQQQTQLPNSTNLLIAEVAHLE